MLKSPASIGEILPTVPFRIRTEIWSGPEALDTSSLQIMSMTSSSLHMRYSGQVFVSWWNRTGSELRGGNAELKQLQKNWLRMFALSSLDVMRCPSSYNTGIDEVILPLSSFIVFQKALVFVGLTFCTPSGSVLL